MTPSRHRFQFSIFNFQFGGAARALLTLTALVAAALAIHEYRTFAGDVSRATTILEQHDIPGRRPEYADLVELSHGLGRSAEYVANAAIADAVTQVNLSGADAATRERWIRAISSVDESLADAQILLLDAAAVRPGWARHLSMIGETEYLLAKTGRQTSLERWRDPLLIGASEEGGTRVAWRALGGAYLEVWPWLPEDERENGKEALREAFHDPRFVQQAFPTAHALLGDTAVELLPDRALSLATALGLMPDETSPDARWHLYQRWDEVEWAEREVDLDEIRHQLRLGNLPRADMLARSWIGVHPFDQYDTPEGLAQLSEVLGAMTTGWVEPWGRGLQTQLVIFLLDPWRREHVDTEGVWRIAERLQGTPEPVLARTRLAADRVPSALRLAESSTTAGGLEWTDFYVDLARHHLDRNDLEGAATALGRVSSVARQQCEVLLTALELAEANDNAPLADSLRTDIRIVSIRGLSARARNGRATVPVCITPSDLAPVPVEITSEHPTIAELGWDRGRTESLLVDDSAELALPPREGSHLLMLTTPLDPTAEAILTLP